MKKTPEDLVYIVNGAAEFPAFSISCWDSCLWFTIALGPVHGSRRSRGAGREDRKALECAKVIFQLFHQSIYRIYRICLNMYQGFRSYLHVCHDCKIANNFECSLRAPNLQDFVVKCFAIIKGIMVLNSESETIEM